MLDAMIKKRTRFSYRINLLNAGAFRWDEMGSEGRERLAYGVETLPVLVFELRDGARGGDRMPLLAISASF